MVRHLLLLYVGAQTGCREKAPPEGVCASLPGKPYFSVERRKPFTRKSPRRRCESLRLIPWKALFFRREAQTFCREKAPAAAGVCASFPGKPYFSVERRKPFAGESARSQWEFAPHSLESLILPSRGANLLPGKGAAGVSLRPAPGKALFFR